MVNAASAPVTNIFGDGSPSWNLPFPAGRLTAPEILAYLPHWIRSVDVIDRFVTNGGRAATIAEALNEFRALPRGDIKTNSVQVMMMANMRRAGYTDWSVGTHSNWRREVARAEDDLNVDDFRTPRITHPRNGDSESSCNMEALPVLFSTLGAYVKKHPEGADALDLTRCVLYALTHQNEHWLFPTDFARLVMYLGGPQTATSSHLDKSVFARREFEITLAKHAARKSVRTPAGSRDGVNATMESTRIGAALLKTRSIAPKISSPEKQENELGTVLAGSKRRSGRLVGKQFNLCEEDSDATDKDPSDSPYSGMTTPAKKLKTSHLALSTEAANDSDFVQDDSEPDDDIPEDDVVEEDSGSPSKARLVRASAKKARVNIKTAFTPERAIPMMFGANGQLGRALAQPAYMTKTYSPEIMEAAAIHSSRVPTLLKPPMLSRDRLRVDESSVLLYAAEGCKTRQEMWDSALSSTRFNGPRRHPPFRELYRLTDPPAFDTSDWAENIRWAKEQYKAFGSDTWTEYDYHLELITEARYETMWVSEETIQAGM